VSAPVCANCRRDATAHFKVIRVDHHGEDHMVTVCSIMCLMKWGYTFATVSGVRLAFGVKNGLSTLLDSLRGPR